MTLDVLTPELQELLAPQERFDALRSRCAMRAGRRLCDFSYANPWEGPRAEVIETLRDALDSGRQLDLQYTPFGGSTITRRLVAEALSRSHGERFGWRDVVMTPGAMAALNVFFRALRREGRRNEVVVLTPCWQDYPLYLVQNGLHPVRVPLEAPGYRLDADRIAAALTPHTRAVLLSQPGNPTGVLYSADELRELAGALEGSPALPEERPWIVSDECHRDWIFPGVDFHSPVQAYDRVCVIYSFGKAHLLQGQRTGYLALSPRAPDRAEMSELLVRITRILGICTPTALMQIAVRRLLQLQPELGTLVARRDRTRDALAGCGYEVTPSDGTFFLYAGCPGGDDFAFVEALASHGVLVLPSSIFHEPGRFRISLTGSAEMLERALPAFRALAPGTT